MRKKRLATLIGIGLTLFTLPAFSATSTLSEKDRDLLRDLHKGNLEEIALGNMAKSKTSNAAVKDFANRMITDHIKVDHQVEQLAAKEGLTLSSSPETMDQTTEKELARHSGSDFDRRYVDAMLEDHQKDIAKVQDTLCGITNVEVRTLLTKALPIFENHIRIAEHVAGQIGVPPDKGLNHPEHPTS